MKKSKTNRGFGIVEFKDSHGNECSLQISSIVGEEHVWLGSNTIGLKHFKAYEGWTDITDPDEVHSIEEHYVANNRMHLSRSRVKELLPHLIKFVETGEL